MVLPIKRHLSVMVWARIAYPISAYLSTAWQVRLILADLEPVTRQWGYLIHTIPTLLIRSSDNTACIKPFAIAERETRVTRCHPYTVKIVHFRPLNRQQPASHR